MAHVPSSVFRACALVAVTASMSAAQAVTVSAQATTPVALGAVVAGQTYSVTTTGVSNLLNGFNGGAGLTFTADGRPTYAFPAPYATFFPNGLSYDPSVGVGSVGPGGAGNLLGALLGTFSAAPSGPSAYFTLGLSYTFTAASSGALYGIVNDTFYGDNAATGFSVTVTPVPEPRTALLLLTGLSAAALWVRHSKR